MNEERITVRLQQNRLKELEAQLQTERENRDELEAQLSIERENREDIVQSKLVLNRTFILEDTILTQNYT